MQHHILCRYNKVMKANSILIGTFINKHKLLSFLEILKNDFKQDLNRIHIYTIESNNYEYLVTFKVREKEQYLKNIRNSTVMHVKNGCLFSINALNKLIEKECGTCNKEYVLDWDKYHNSLIILTNGNLVIEKLVKIEDKCSIIF